MSPEDMALLDLHRDADGNGLLVGPDCPDCARRAVVVYRCTRCPHRIEVPGEFRWYWQGRGHWHQAEDPDWHAAVRVHLDAEHDGVGGFLPAPA